MSYPTADLTWLGVSSDGRTNRWRAKCPDCGKIFVPLTTIRGSEVLNCPRTSCKKPMTLAYNAAIDRLEKK